MIEKVSHIKISIAKQAMMLFFGSDFAGLTLHKEYLVSTAKNGVGQLHGSECTPLGEHEIAEKIGSNAPENAVFVTRQWTQEIYSEELAASQANRDWILTRILWLEGLEPGVNQGQLKNIDACAINGDVNEADDVNKVKEQSGAISCDTKQRYIYIHGCPDSHAMQIPSSHGCIKMRNVDIIELFDLVDVGTPVSIVEK